MAKSSLIAIAMDPFAKPNAMTHQSIATGSEAVPFTTARFPDTTVISTAMRVTPSPSETTVLMRVQNATSFGFDATRSITPMGVSTTKEITEAAPQGTATTTTLAIDTAVHAWSNFNLPLEAASHTLHSPDSRPTITLTAINLANASHISEMETLKDISSTFSYTPILSTVTLQTKPASSPANSHTIIGDTAQSFAIVPSQLNAFPGSSLFNHANKSKVAHGSDRAVIETSMAQKVQQTSDTTALQEALSLTLLTNGSETSASTTYVEPNTSTTVSSAASSVINITSAGRETIALYSSVTTQMADHTTFQEVTETIVHKSPTYSVPISSTIFPEYTMTIDALATTTIFEASFDFSPGIHATKISSVTVVGNLLSATPVLPGKIRRAGLFRCAA